MYMTIVALSPTNSETSTLVVPTPSPKKMRQRKYLTPPPRNPLPETYTPETPTVVKSPILDDLHESAPFGTPEQPDEREHIYPPKTKRRKLKKKKGGRSIRKHRRRTLKRVIK